MSTLLSIYVAVASLSVETITFVRISAMFIPAVGVTIMRLFFKDPVRSAGWRRFPVKWLPAALFLIPLAIHSINLPLVGYLNSMEIPWQSWLTADSEGIFHAPESRGWGDLTMSELAMRLALNAIVGLIIVSILAFFEEIGWRAWMLPKLQQGFSPRRAVLVSAVIWALWHVPFVVSGLNYLDEVPMLQMLVLYPTGLIGAGMVLGWLWVRTRSIWIVSLAHGSLNNWGQFAFKYMRDGSGEPMDWPWLYTGVNFSLLLIGIIVLVTLGKETTKN